MVRLCLHNDMPDRGIAGNMSTSVWSTCGLHNGIPNQGIAGSVSASVWSACHLHNDRVSASSSSHNKTLAWVVVFNMRFVCADVC